MTERKSLKSISLIVQENPKAVSAVCLCLLLSSLVEAIGVAAIFPLISIILETGSSLPASGFTDFINKIAENGPYFLAAFVVCSFILKSVMLGVATRIIASNVASFSHRLRVSFVESMLNARVQFIFSRSLGQSLSVLTNDSITAAAAYTSAARVLSGFFQALIYFIYAIWLSTEATFLSVLTMGVLVVVVKATMDRARKAGFKTTEYIHEISKNMGEALRGAKEAKATARESYLASYIFEGSDQLRRAHAANLIVGQTLRNIQDPITVASALICLLLFRQVVDLEPGYIMFILAVYYRLMTSVNLMMADYQKFVGQEAALWSIKDGIRAAEDEREKLQSGGIVPTKTPQPINFKNISVNYGEKQVFSNISFTVPPAKLTAFKGESGKGKTTCVDIICGLVRPSVGEVLVGSDKLEDLDMRLWRNNIGYVDQFPFLFKGSVRDNIVLDTKGVTDKRVHEILKLCHLTKFVSGLADGLNHQLHEGGSNISGGQRQRIAIARSLIRDPAYLILDEPTSALDQESAETVFRTLTALSEYISVIVISHSAEAEKYADTIIDFDVF